MVKVKISFKEKVKRLDGFLSLAAGEPIILSNLIKRSELSYPSVERMLKKRGYAIGKEEVMVKRVTNVVIKVM